MLQLQIIGNIGADATVRESNGRRFVSFNVAHNYQQTDRATGEVKVEERVWVSCALNGDGGQLLPYLRKGTLVFVSGNPRFKMYKGHDGMQIDVSLSVDSIKLLPRPITKKETDLLEVLDNVMKQVEAFGFTDFESFFKECETKSVKKQ